MVAGAGPVQHGAQAGVEAFVVGVAVLRDDRGDLLGVAAGDAEADRRAEVRLFVREHARRRWCSTTCGDRVRAARHQRRVEEQRRATTADA
ncbi:MAG: CGNR zinc finger domain-containing protein [Actinoallomurus sp.]